MAITKVSRGLLSTGISDSSDATAVTIDSSENVLVGSGTSNGISGSTTGLQVAGAGFAGMISATRHDNNAYSSALMLGKSRNTTVGSNTIVQSGDEIGAIGFFADDGTNLDSQVAYIRASVDGTPGENDTPGRLTFSTTADGSAAATERMRINSSGNVGIGTTSPTRPLTVAGSMNLTGTGTYIFGGDNEILAGQDAGGYYFATGNQQDVNKTIYIGDNASSINFAVNNSERMRLDSSGNLCLGTNSAFSGSILSVRSRFSDTSGFTVQMFSANDAEQFSIRGDGALFVGTDGNSPYSNTTGDSANAVLLSNGVLARSTSSQRYKKDIADATWGLTEVKQLRPVTFKSNRTGEFASDKTHGGLIAEEVHALGLTEFVDYNDSNEPDALHYGNMVALLTKAIQEQQTQIEALQSEINTLKGGD